uniref:Uncharacterized protein n=1 Tax=viral metagenome TaxID=1070528 RepID=A0A6H2A467_9ZZZZ
MDNYMARPLEDKEIDCPVCNKGIARMEIDGEEILDTCQTCGGTGRIKINQ